MKQIKELQGFRTPTQQEVQVIRPYFQKLFDRDLHITKTSAILFGIVTAASLLCVSIAGIPALAVCVISFFIAVTALRSKQNNMKKLQDIQNGNYQVLDGTVDEISVNPDFPGTINVRFRSCHGEVLKTWCTVRMEEVQVGTSLLLVYFPAYELSRTFTPFMFTEEGLKHWL